MRCTHAACLLHSSVAAQYVSTRVLYNATGSFCEGPAYDAANSDSFIFTDLGVSPKAYHIDLLSGGVTALGIK